jgi:HEAT repeat protein
MTILRVRFPITVCAILVAFCQLLAVNGLAQRGDDPFAVQSDDPDDPASKLYELPAIDPGLPEGTRLIIRAVRKSNLATDVDFAKAVRLMMDIEQYKDAKFYLYQLKNLAQAPPQLFAVYEALGSDFFLRLHANEQMQPEGRAFAKKVLAVAKSESESPQRLDQFIQTLSDPDISVRSVAFRKLRRIGPAAVASMVSVFADESRAREFPAIRQALKKMGDDAIVPLMGAARANDLQVQAEAIRALGSYRSSDATDVMMRTYLSPKMPDSLRRIASDSLVRSHRMPADPTYVEDRFYERSLDYLLGRRRVPDTHLEKSVLWQWDAGDQRLKAVELEAPLAARIVAAQRASDLYEIRPNLPRNREIYILTQLEAAKRIIGPTRRINAKRWMDQFAPCDSGEIARILSKAIDLDLIPAATACCEILGETGNADLVYGFGNQHRELVRALMVGDRHLQFAAFSAIASLDPQNAFAGSSFMPLMAVYLAGSQSGSAGLVGHVRADLARSYASIMPVAGLVGRSVTDGREFFRAATSDPDLEVLLVTDTMTRPDYAELIQILRKDLRTSRTPIGVLYRKPESRQRIERLAERDPFLLPLPFSSDPEFVEAHARRLVELTQPWKVSELDRREHAAKAVDWLRKVTSDRQRYGFYNFGKYESQLSLLLYSPGFADSASDILVNLGTPKAQQELIKFASQNGLPLESRQKAVEALGRSLENAGTMLTRDEIQLQYDRYNASRNQPRETQQVLGSILDALEARVKNSDQ